MRELLLIAAMVFAPQAASAQVTAHVDHIMLGVADLDQGVDAFEKLTGVRPVYGGKHPTGTHNALVSLGDGTYLELIAAQPDAPPQPMFKELAALQAPTPIGWAVSASDAQALRDELTKAGFSLTALKEGSRATPAGAVLQWQTFGLADEAEGGPFFIVWSKDTPHPSTTSPAGCRLAHWSIAGPKGDPLDRLLKALPLPVTSARAPTLSMTLELTCPKGSVTFKSP